MTDSEKIIELASQSGMTGLSLIDIGYLEAFYRAAQAEAFERAAARVETNYDFSKPLATVIRALKEK